MRARRRPKLLPFLNRLSLLGMAVIGAPTAGAAATLVATLEPPTALASRRFAAEMDVDGDRVLVGSAQAAYLYHRPADPTAAWPQQTLTPTLQGYSGGSPVAIYGGRAAFANKGAGTAAQQAGGVNFFTQNEAGGGYTVSQTTWPADSKIFDQFGASVELGDGIAFVGADNDDHNGKPSTGTVTLFRDAGAGVYEEVKKFAPDNLGGGHAFGLSMDLDDDRLAVAAFGSGANIGAVYVYERNAGGSDNWGQTALLSDVVRFFGADVALDGDTLIASTTSLVNDVDLVTLFDYDEASGNWKATKRLASPDPAPGDQYGYSVAISGDLAVVTRPSAGSNLAPSRPGAAYVYSRNLGGAGNWGLLTTLTPPDPARDSAFGSSVEIMGNLVLVGSLDLSDPSHNAVYVYLIPEPSSQLLLAAALCLTVRGRRQSSVSSLASVLLCPP